ncbi:MAG: putative membrane protein [Maribacter sp.]|jgi:uncharacterized membrane protein
MKLKQFKVDFFIGIVSALFLNVLTVIGKSHCLATEEFYLILFYNLMIAAFLAITLHIVLKFSEERTRLFYLASFGLIVSCFAFFFSLKDSFSEIQDRWFTNKHLYGDICGKISEHKINNWGEAVLKADKLTFEEFELLANRHAYLPPVHPESDNIFIYYERRDWLNNDHFFQLYFSVPRTVQIKAFKKHIDGFEESLTVDTFPKHSRIRYFRKKI